CMQTLEFPWMF
nr:immunoglobulin light chain junction region [Macaca mulatta]